MPLDCSSIVRRGTERRRPRRHCRPSPTVAQPEQPVGVTVLTKKPFDVHGQSCEFRFYNNETTMDEFEPYVEANRRRWPENLATIVVEATRPETACHGTGNLPTGLRDQLARITANRLPTHIIDSVFNGQVRQPYVPGERGNARGNAAWVLKYRGGTGLFHDNPEPNSKQADHLMTETTWVGAWVGRQVLVTAKPRHEEKPKPPMAVIIIYRHPRHASSDPNYYGKKMADQYTTMGTNYRWAGVRDQPLFLFMDMDRLFNKFHVNIATSSLRINKYMDPGPYDRRHGVIPRVGRLKEALLTLAEFRTEFKTHELARKSMEKIVQYYVTVDEKTDHSRQTSSDRLCDMLYQLGNEQETLNLEVEMLQEQCVYLMDTEFNTVAARTDARLGVLTVLAFVLTPAGFVVSLFSVIESGTTQLIVSTIMVAFFSIVVYIAVDGLYKSAERKKLPNGLFAPERDRINGNW
ncbi:hypothetical protein KVR01_003031 [Diaporthe batatas]|uniref:uncharacterized protein n=1 Tax=Diaporthe batatas TaxID=748121 RepID=UPI001D03611D|nr:uncharacterized protein KVR01_003031 [Diaporthe batatas]KAG8167342.1 hypothetical protein KVR01_003031 [Diaporthe batatas]